MPRIGGRLRWQHLGLTLTLLLATCMNCWQLTDEGYGNTYYAAAVKSMLTSWHNFFFVSFDAGGFVAVDKPPLGLWIQAASARIFGFHPLSLLLPQALAGIAAVALLYYLVTRAFGATAGLLAALALAVMPISVVTNRNNTSDGVLVLALLGAAWAVSVAAESGRLGPLLLGAALVGLGFNIKMLQAYLVVPPLALIYLVGAPLGWWRRIGRLLCAAAVMLVVSLAWVVTVDLTPASARPYVGSSGTNSALSLTLGYNGLSRLTDAFFTRFPGLHLLSIPVDLNVAPAFSAGIGEPGLSRLLNRGLAGQVGWLLPFAVLGLVVGAWQTLREPVSPDRLRRRLAITFWGGWLVTVGGFFDFARFFHTYYLIMLGPAIAALVGIGGVTLARWYRAEGWRGWLLPPALIAAALVQAHILADYPDWSRWLTPLIVGASVAAAVALAVARLHVFRWSAIARLAWVGGMLVLLLAPFEWSALSVRDGNGGAWLPQAGPQAMLGGPPRGGGGPRTTGAFPGGAAAGPSAPTTSGGFSGGGPGGFPAASDGRAGPGGGGPGFGAGGAMTFAGNQWDSLDPNLVAYLRANQGTARYLVATPTSSYASLFILATDQPALALGGYQGWDRIVTPADLGRMVGDGTVRFFYLSGGATNGATNADLSQWVQTSCTAVPASAWGSTSGTGGRGGFGQANQLYDCAAHA